jgi:XTP/dITP diphosphohydrolase
VLATGNAGKRREWERLLEGRGVELLHLDLPSPTEDGVTCRDNAVLKAVAAHRATGLPALADDVGLEVEALGGAPGTELRPWAEGLGGWPAARRALAEVAGSPATYVCGLALADAGGVHAVEARTPGRVVAPRGEGPGVEACFVPHGDDRTLAELPWEDRVKVHHRAVALASLLGGQR